MTTGVKKQQQKGVFLNLFSVLTMSTGPILDKMALQSINPTLAVIIVYIYNSIFALFAVRRNLSRQFLKKLLTQSRLLVMALSNSIAIIMLFYGLDLTDPVAVGFLRRFYVVFALLLSYFLLGERFTYLEGIFILISVLGAFVFISEGAMPNPRSLLGSGLIIFSTLLFAFANLEAKRHIGRFSTWELMAVNSWIVLFFVLCYGLIIEPKIFSTITAEATALLGISSLVSSFLGLALFYTGLRYLSYWKSNIIRTVQPVFVTLYSLPFFPQAVTWPRLLGGGLLIISLVGLLIVGSQRPAETSPAPSRSPTQ